MICRRMSRPADVAGSRCATCDPVVAATTYGLRRDGFRRIVDRVVVVGGKVARIDRTVLAWAQLEAFTVDIKVRP